MRDLQLTIAQARHGILLASHFEARLKTPGTLIAASRQLAAEQVIGALIEGIVAVLVAKSVCTDAEAREAIRLKLNNVLDGIETRLGRQFRS